MNPFRSDPRSVLLKTLFFLSGLTGLVYETVWARILSTILGNTSLAVSVTVSIFLTGLAAGSFLGARLNLRGRSPWLFYGILEALIGGYSAATPYLAYWVERIYAVGYPAVSGNFFYSILLKAVPAALLLLLPAIAMGATLPILIRFYESGTRQAQAASLYGLNTAGAVAGTLLAGYFLIPRWGISNSIHAAACINGLIAAIAILAVTKSREEPASTARIPAFRTVYLLFFLTGFATLCYEILWTRALSMFFGSSVYAFSCILAAFLLGIACGSALYAKVHADPFQLFSFIQFRIALSAIFFVAIFMGLPPLLVRLFQAFHDSFALFQLSQFLLISMAIFYTAFLSGTAFPAALQFFRANQEHVHLHAGYVYTYNTAGSILGSLCAGFVLIPTLGVERSIRLVVLLNLLVGMYCFRKTPPAMQNRRVLLIGAVSLAFLILFPPWNKSTYNAGFYAFAYKYVPGNARSSSFEMAPSALEAGFLPAYGSREQLDLIYYSEGLTATVAVAESDGGDRSLLINGKPDASNVPTGDMRTQLLLGHLPVLLGAIPNDVLVIGLGSGVTAGALEVYQPRRLDCVEIERKVAEAARYFEAQNGKILSRPNFHLIVDDGRNLVQHTDARYDVITSEPSNLWMSGVANLFTQEFFRAAKNKLRPNGILCQWIHLYQISWRDVQVFLKTFHSVFPHLSIWVDDSDMLVLGSEKAMFIDPGKIQQILSHPQVKHNLAGSEITVGGLLRQYAGDEGLIDLLEPGLPLNTDDRPVLEFSAPRSLFVNHAAQITRTLFELQDHHKVTK